MFDGTLGNRLETCGAVLEALEPGRWVTLKGPPGVGKSASARAVCADLEGQGHAIITLVLEQSLGRAEVLVRLGAVLGVGVRATDETVWFEAVRRALDSPRQVLFVDGPGARSAAALLHELLVSTSALRVLVCAWQPLGGTLEQCITVEPLPVADAERLLRQLLQRRGCQSPEDLSVLVQSTGGLPLAVELLAGRLAMLGTALVTQATSRGLSGEALDDSIAAALGVDGAETTLRQLAQLSVFRGTFDGASALQVLGGTEPLRALEGLVERSLVHAEAGAFVVLDTIRSFAERHASPEVLEAARARHAAVMAAPTEARPQQAHAFAALARRREDLLAAWRWAVAQPTEGARTLELARTLDSLLLTQGPGTLHREVLVRSLACAQGDSAVRLDVLLALGRLDAIRGRHALALGSFHEARRRAEAADDEVRLGWACAFSSYSERPLGRLEDSAESGARALRIARRRRDLPMSAMAEIALSTLALSRGETDAAVAGFRRTIALGVLAEAPRIEGIGAGNLGATWLALGRLDEAAQALERGRRAFERVGDRFHLARLTVDEARLAVARRQSDAEPLVLRALEGVSASETLEGQLLACEALVTLARQRHDSALEAERLSLLEALVSHCDDVSWRRRLARLKGTTTAQLRLTHDGRSVELDGQTFDFSRRGPLRRVLLALARSPDALSADDVRAAGWPNEKMFPESAAARVYMAVNRLRALGFDRVLVTQDDGYRLAPEVDVEWRQER